MTNGGVSKANKGLHVSEDVFGGYNVMLRGRDITYVDYISVGKGRDMGFETINTFECKVILLNQLHLPENTTFVGLASSNWCMLVEAGCGTAQYALASSSDWSTGNDAALPTRFDKYLLGRDLLAR
jgi:hypothetical protein